MAKRDRSLALLLGLACVLSFGARGGDVPGDSWTRFRGEAGNGIASSTNLPVRWSDSDIRWKTRLPGKGHSSPVIWQERLFVTSGNVTNADRHILCLSTSDGTVLWQKTHASRTHPHNRENSYGSCTPAVDRHAVYASWATPDQVTVTALSHEGRELWLKNLGPFKGQHGSGASPVVYHGLVWINNDQDGPSSLIALDARSGEIKHKIERRPHQVSYATPCLLQQPGKPDQLIFAASSHGLTSVDPRDGTINWELTNLFPARVVSSPFTSDGLILAACGEGGVGRRLIAVQPPEGTNPARLVYDMKPVVPYVPTSVARDGRLYLVCDNGLVRCVRTATGETLWQERLPEKFYSSPVLAGNRLYLVSKTGEVFVLAAESTYQLLARNSLGEASFATPAIAHNTLFFRTETQLIAVGSRL